MLSVVLVVETNESSVSFGVKFCQNVKIKIKREYFVAIFLCFLKTIVITSKNLKNICHIFTSELAFFQLVFIVFRQALKTQCNLMLNPSWELEPNIKLVHHHLPSIFHGALVGVSSLWP
jgi:hypothetical protein